MKTNYINRLQNENAELKARIDALLTAVKDTEVYYSSAKFQGTDNDYAYVKTDVLPRLAAIKRLAWADPEPVTSDVYREIRESKSPGDLLSAMTKACSVSRTR